MLVVLPLALASFLIGRGLRPLHFALVSLLAVATILAPQSLRSRRPELGPVVHEHWDSMGRLAIHQMGRVGSVCFWFPSI